MIAVQTALAKDIAMGLSILMFCQIMGGAIFVVVGHSLFNDRLLSLLANTLPQKQLQPESLLDAGATAFRNLGLSHELLSKFIPDFSTAITDTFYVGVALSCASIVGALAVEWKSIKIERQ